ncbi:hypothetical protein, partial [Moorena sp. SIO4G3]|uniref:hypothetical protein n=1 Tax=Moorena sp. SIO4G3 TaxID=2607821 RepID=UPI0034317117
MITTFLQAAWLAVMVFATSLMVQSISFAGNPKLSGDLKLFISGIAFLLRSMSGITRCTSAPKPYVKLSPHTAPRFSFNLSACSHLVTC